MLVLYYHYNGVPLRSLERDSPGPSVYDLGDPHSSSSLTPSNVHDNLSDSTSLRLIGSLSPLVYNTHRSVHTTYTG